MTNGKQHVAIIEYTTNDEGDTLCAELTGAGIVAARHSRSVQILVGGERGAPFERLHALGFTQGAMSGGLNGLVVTARWTRGDCE